MFLASSRRIQRAINIKLFDQPILSINAPARVAITENHSHSLEGTRKAVYQLLTQCNPPLSKLIKHGDKVLIKPYLHVAGSGASRRHSHPNFIRAVVEAVQACGGNVCIGDEGSKTYHTSTPPPDKEWIYELARTCNAGLISFAKSGGRTVPSSLLYPRKYLIANALFEADVVINCANFQPHARLVLSGAVRNMFNAALGKTQDHFYELFKSNEMLAKVVVDVCRVVRPTFSFLDVTAVREPGNQETEHPVGLIMASQDPVALDLLAAKAVGYEGEKIFTTIYGGQMGLGCSDLDHLEVNGIAFNRTTLHNKQLPTPHITAPSESTIGTVSRIINKTILRPRPVLIEDRCNNCSDCEKICPTNAIAASETTYPHINLGSCMDCHLCMSVCTNEAIVPKNVGIGYFVHKKKTILRTVWNEAKVGFDLPMGPLSASIRFKKSGKVFPLKDMRVDVTQNNAIIDDRPQTKKRSRAAVGTEHIQPMTSDADKAGETAIIFGVGPSLGSALARRFAKGPMNVAMVARNAKKLEPLVNELRGFGVKASAYSADVQFDRSVRKVMKQITQDFGNPGLVVYNVEHFIPGGILEIETPAFIECWQAMCLGAFIVGREAARLMIQDSQGTIIFTGATASTRGRAGYINMAVGKWGIRALAQSMARELSPQGIHVAHVVVDGGIAAPSNEGARQRMSALFPEEIAETYYHLHKQHRSTWTHEIDLRPWVETF